MTAGDPSCSILPISRSARASSSRSGFTLVRSAGSEECTMFELILGLGVSLALAIYLVVTLLAPERF